MLRWFERPLILSAVIAAVALPAFADNHEGQNAGGSQGSAAVSRDDAYDRMMARDYERLRAKGYRDRDIHMAFNAAQRTGREPEEILSRLDRGQTWTQIAADLNLSERELAEPRSRTAGARNASMQGSDRPTSGQGSDRTVSGSAGMGMRRTDDYYNSRRYILTPLEHKRLRAHGLRDREVYLAANTAHLTGRSVDDIMQMIFRGHTAATLAEWYDINPKALNERRPEWESPEWQTAVEHGDTWPPSMRTRSENRR